MEGIVKKRINITLEDDVVKRVDRYADAMYTSRSGAITRLIMEATDSAGQPVRDSARMDLRP